MAGEPAGCPLSDGSQVVDLQRDALLAAGVEPGYLYQDAASGKRDDRPRLAACLKALRTGDVLVAWKFDRLGRDLRHLVNLVHELTERGSALKVLTGHSAAIDTTTASGKLVFHLALRQAEGFAGSVLRLPGIDRAVPDHTTLSRQSRTFAGRRLGVAPHEPLHLVIDSTGLQLFGRRTRFVSPDGGAYRRHFISPAFVHRRPSKSHAGSCDAWTRNGVYTRVPHARTGAKSSTSLRDRVA